MKPRTVNIIRDLAIKYEKEDVQVAFDLMKLVHYERPDVPPVQEKYQQYLANLKNLLKEQEKLSLLVDNCEIAIIPIGFRCDVTRIIREKLGVRQASLPFNNGFFPPNAVASIMENPKILMEFDDQGKTHSVCIKNENNRDEKFGLGIKFTSSTYEHINATAVKGLPSINKYLDSTFGYYTLNKKHKFILAHYNWHSLADVSKSKGVTNPKENLNIINDILNKRIQRMIEMCNKAKHVFFIFGETQNYKYMQLDEEYFVFDDFTKLKQVCNNKFGAKFTVCNISDIDTSKILAKVTTTKDRSCEQNKPRSYHWLNKHIFPSIRNYILQKFK